MDLLDVKTAFLDDEEYKSLLNTIKSYGINVPAVDNDLAFAIKADPPMIIFRDVVKSLDEDTQKVIIAHETAHLVGIKNEEEADRWAISALTTESEKNILKRQWKYRHGHDYREK